jgi:UDP-3-O-[3-hydroxymyristoyl] glucosamine N-acyltransferase
MGWVCFKDSIVAMYLSKEVLNSIQNHLIFFNLSEVFVIADCEQILDRKNKMLIADCIYWLDYSPLNENDFIKSKGVILINKKELGLFRDDLFNSNRIIVADNPRLLFRAIDEFLIKETTVPEIHPTANVHPFAILGTNILIGPGSVIEESCQLGDNVLIHDHCSIGKGVQIGHNTVIHSGSRIGFNVFGFKKNQSGDWMKFQQIASVTIGNNVTIGANTCINNGFMTDTVISDFVFIDSLCQIGESVIIGQNTIIAAHCFIAANTKIGSRCWISPNVSIRENVHIVDDVFIGIGSVVLRNIKLPCRVFGIPAKRLSL